MVLTAIAMLMAFTMGVLLPVLSRRAVKRLDLRREAKAYKLVRSHGWTLVKHPAPWDMG